MLDSSKNCLEVPPGKSESWQELWVQTVEVLLGKNLANIETEFNLCPWTKSPASFKKSYIGYLVPPEDSWRLPLLGKLLAQRREMNTCGDETSTITGLIDSLCVS